MVLKKIQVVLETEELKRFDNIADAQERSRSFLIRKAIQNFLSQDNKSGDNYGNSRN